MIYVRDENSTPETERIILVLQGVIDLHIEFHFHVFFFT